MESTSFLLNKLRKNSRLRISKLSRSVNEPVTTMHFRLKRLEKDVIKKYVSLIDFEKEGYKRFIFVVFDDSPGLVELISEKKFVNNIYRTNRGAIFECVFKNMSSVDRFSDNLSEKRIKYSRHPVFGVEKQEGMNV